LSFSDDDYATASSWCGVGRVAQTRAVWISRSIITTGYRVGRRNPVTQPERRERRHRGDHGDGPSVRRTRWPALRACRSAASPAWRWRITNARAAVVGDRIANQPLASATRNRSWWRASGRAFWTAIGLRKPNGNPNACRRRPGTVENRKIPREMAPQAGLEPATLRLTAKKRPMWRSLSRIARPCRMASWTRSNRASSDGDDVCGRADL